LTATDGIEPGTLIQSAHLELTCAETTDFNSPFNLRLRSVNEAWNEGEKVHNPATTGETTWDWVAFDTQRWKSDVDGDGGPDAGCSAPASHTDANEVVVDLTEQPLDGDLLRVDVTAMAQHWIDNGPLSNHGFILIAPDHESDLLNFMAFHSAEAENQAVRPKLVIVPLKIYQAPRAVIPPTMDGVLEEYDQADEISLGQPGQTSGKIRLMWDETALYVALQASDSQLNASYSEDDGEIWADDGLAVVLDVGFKRNRTLNDGDFSFAANILGARLDAQGHYEPEPNAFDAEWEVQVVLDGTANFQQDSDVGYTMELSIPFDELALAAPAVDDLWGLELQLNDMNAAGEWTGTPWSTPEDGDFSSPTNWGGLRFADQGLICAAGWEACGGECVNLQTSSLHCGKCDQPCGASEICNQGVCRPDCGPGTVEQDGQCVAKEPTGCGQSNSNAVPPASCLLLGLWWLMRRRSRSDLSTRWSN
jgi:hypothetical protein